MMLTPAQLASWKTDIAANTNETPQYPGVQIKNLDINDSDHANAIAIWYSVVSAPDFLVFRSDVSLSEIFDQVTWANYTPSDAPDATVIWTNRSLACQGKQFNLQIMLQGAAGVAFNAGKIQLRTGVNDATTNLPSGAAGASRSGGWAGILPILRRKAKRIEKLFAVQTTGVGTNGGDALGATTNPALMNFEGSVTYSDLQA